MKIRIVGDSVALTKDETLIRNSDKTYHVIFTFDESWDGYTKTATFKAGGRTVEVSVLNNECDIPSEILSTAGVMLKVQVSGSKNGESKATMWGNLSYILFETSVSLPPLPSSVTKGYFHNGSFYNDEEHTSLIEPEEGGLYYDYSGKKIYIYDGENYSETSGSMVTAGRFLSYWDSETGLPKTDPAEIPYVYYTGDFYIVSDVPEDTTLYRPEGTVYDGTASTEKETAFVGVFDFYFFDGEVWLLLKNSNPKDPYIKVSEGIEIVKLTDATETLSAIADRLDEINSAGLHVLFDTAALGEPMYLCTIMISYNGDAPTAYRVNDLVTGKTALGIYNANKEIGDILQEAVSAWYTLIVTCTTQDGVLVTGQTVTLHSGDSASAPVYATAEYNGQPVSFVVPNNFVYYVSVSNTLEQHFNPTTATGLITTDTAVALTYSDISTISTFGDIKAALNAGIDLSELVGESVTATRQNTSLAFDVADYDAVEKSVWLLLHDTMPNQMNFEPKQALAWFAEGLPAGSYYFTHSNRNYYFTLTNPIPEDGQLMATTSTFSTYVNQDASTALESGSVSETEIAGAASLGTTATGNLNHMDRVLYGSNNAGESGLFTWLNSDAEPNTNLPRLNKFSRPYPSGSDGGFLRGFDAADLECLEDVEWTIRANQVYEAPSSMGGIAARDQQYTITGKIGLAKLANVGLSGSNPWDLYVGATNTDRIKYYNGSKKTWWVFEPLAMSAASEYHVDTSGKSDSYYSRIIYGVVPACKIRKDAV